MLYKTPIHFLMQTKSRNQVFCKRDDLLPFSFGGNKVRIASEYFEDMKEKGCDCIIGYGSSSSNMNRIIANMAYAKNVKCYIIESYIEGENIERTYNSYMVSICGAKIVRCSKADVADTVEKVIECAYSEGFKPYYINGNKYGKGNETIGARAYVKAYSEIVEQSLEMSIDFDMIFLTAGTGLSQAGLIAGQFLSHGKSQIIGISISRKQEQEKKIINNIINAYLEEKSPGMSFNGKIEVCDEYLFGGYGQGKKELYPYIIRYLTRYGIPLDSIYTGKAFYGMERYLEEKKINNKNVLFIHTGGTPLFFEELNHKLEGL